ncbi:MAG TPA: metallopeptidase family protein [Actinomycetes bacterium]|nr:metallopeptidase family protein [Actinomycetes bacterium]
MLDVPPEQFERLVGEALDSLPEQLGRVFDNVAVMVEDERAGQPNLLGLYEGIPLTERGQWYSGVLPDRVTIFRLPILRRCATYADVVAEVRVTVVHELAHHMGIDDERLEELGWG